MEVRFLPCAQKWRFEFLIYKENKNSNYDKMGRYRYIKSNNN